MISERQARAEVESWVACIADPDHLLEVRCIRGEDTDRDWVQAARLIDRVPKLRKLNADGWHVYVCPAPRKRRGGKTDDCQCWPTLWADWDGVPPDAAEVAVDESGLPRPTIMLATGGGTHAYWRLAEPLTDPELWKRYQRSLSDAAQSDPAVNKPPQPMRVPGFLNCKQEYGDPRPCRIVFFDPDERHGIDELGIEPKADAPPADRPTPRVLPLATGGPEDRRLLSRLVWDFVERGDTGAVHPTRGGPAERNLRLYGMAGHMAYVGIDYRRARAWLLRGAALCGYPEDRAERDIARGYDNPKNVAGYADASGMADAMLRLRRQWRARRSNGGAT